MKVIVQIPDDRAAFGIQVLHSLDFVDSIEEQYSVDEEFEKKWNDPSNLTLSEARILTKSKIKAFWKK
ncbi:MAG: hypothetical protein V4683_03930 [Bacteroidota bacterium]